MQVVIAYVSRAGASLGAVLRAAKVRSQSGRTTWADFHALVSTITERRSVFCSSLIGSPVAGWSVERVVWPFAMGLVHTCTTSSPL